jgi:hypothetical protein
LCTGEPAPTPAGTFTFLYVWGLLIDHINPGNIKFELRDPDFLILGWDILPWLKATYKNTTVCLHWYQSRCWLTQGHPMMVNGVQVSWSRGTQLPLWKATCKKNPWEKLSLVHGSFCRHAIDWATVNQHPPAHHPLNVRYYSHVDEPQLS